MPVATFRILRGDAANQRIEDYSIEVTEGMVVLDAVHGIQARWQTTSLFGGIARRVNVAHVPLRSMACLN
jgi:succinate dehydrogenase/fumarate reductase-like Fe-S protein